MILKYSKKKDRLLQIILFIVVVYPTLLFSQQLKLSEIMFAPAGTNCEFMEVYNNSDTLINLKNYLIKYHTSTADTILSISDNYELLPYNFAIIFEADYDFENGIYKNLIPTNTLVFILDDNAFGSTGMANTSDRTIYLINSNNDTVDVYTYSANNENGFSDERIEYGNNGWDNSRIANGTPGYKNSVSPLLFDAAIENVSANPPNVIVDEFSQINIEISNLGTEIISGLELNLYEDRNSDSLFSVDELLFTKQYNNLNPAEKYIFQENVQIKQKGENKFIAELNFIDDEFLENNERYFFIYGTEINEIKGDLVINEIMYSPINDEPEWFEIYNRSDKSILIKNYQISDAGDTITIENESLELKPKEYLVFADDQTILNFYPGLENVIIAKLPTLNNTTDEIKIMDSLSRVIDSVSYSSVWGGKYGNSLERINSDNLSVDSSNWKTSKYPTPGKINSISKKEFDLKIEAVNAAPQNSKLNEVVKISAKISNIGKQQITFSLQLFNDINNDNIEDDVIEESQKFTIEPNELFEFKFDSEIFTKNTYQNFLVKLNCEDDDFTNNYQWVKINSAYEKYNLVITEIMYSPLSPEPEWIEVYNTSEKEISLKEFKTSDVTDTNEVTNNDIKVLPKQYFVIADDSSISQIYPSITSFIVTNLPTLNNTEDKILLLDSLNRVIDSVYYNSDYGGSNGKSLEKIDPLLTIFDQNNWKESFSPTPGKVNSVTQKDYDVKIDSVYTNLKFPLIGEKIKIGAKIKNIGKQQFTFSLKLWKDTNLDSLKDSSLAYSENIILNSSDSIYYILNYEILVNENLQNFIIEIDTEDENLLNNSMLFKLFPSYPKESLVINEIMFLPSNDEPEWIELFNKSEFNINLINWEIGDVLTNPVYKIITDKKFIIQPTQYLLVTKSNTVLNYHKSIPSKIIEANFANLNNDTDGMVIKDQNGNTIDSVKYLNNWDSENGKSIERIKSDNNSNNSNNWSVSKDIEGSTPGRINSVSPKYFDLSVASINTNPAFPVKNEEITIETKIYNNGNNNADNFTIEFYYEEKTTEILLESQSNLSLSNYDSLTLESINKILITDTLYIKVKIIFDHDEDPVNNYFEKYFVAGFNSKSVLINEIMFKTEGNNSEWIEIVNNTDSTINLKNWLIGDLSEKIILTEEDYFIDENEFVIIENSSSQNLWNDTKVIKTFLPELNDKKDAVIIYDYRNAVIDSVFYNYNNFPTNTSLERIDLTKSSEDESNWTFSLDQNGSTPGKENSILFLPNNNFGDVVITEIMFDPNEDNSEYIEIYNSKDLPIELGGWQILVDDKPIQISNKSYLLNPNEYFVISSDSLIFINYAWLNGNSSICITNSSSLDLTNTGKSIYILDYKNQIIDSVKYSDAWHNSVFQNTKNISLELININLERNKASNWSSSVSSFGGTPLRQNSIFINNIIEETKLSISPNPFSPDNDGFEDFTIINYNLKESIAQIRIRIYDSKGRLVRNLANNLPSGSKGEIVFDGLDNNKNPLKLGIYIVLFEAVNTRHAVVEIIKDVVVIARKF